MANGIRKLQMKKTRAAISRRLALFVFAFLVFCASPQFAHAVTPQQCEAAWARLHNAQAGADPEDFVFVSPGEYSEFANNWNECPQADEARNLLILLSREVVAGADRERNPYIGRSTSPPPQLSNGQYTAVGRFLTRSAAPTSVGGGYAVVLLSEHAERNRDACNIFTRVLEFTSDAVDARPLLIDGVEVYRRPVYWLTHQPLQATAECEDMLRRYDFARSAIVLSRLRQGMNEPRLGRGDGPYLAIIRADGGVASVVNFSEIPLDEFRRVFIAFLRDVAHDPAIWRNGYYRDATWRERLRKSLAEDAAPHFERLRLAGETVWGRTLMPRRTPNILQVGVQ